MPHYLIRLAEDEYIDWSTIVDAPATYIMGRDEAVSRWGSERIARTDRNGHSMHDWKPETPEQAVSFNRCGEWHPDVYDNGTYQPGESEEDAWLGEKRDTWTLDQIRQYYRRDNCLSEDETLKTIAIEAETMQTIRNIIEGDR